MSQIVLSEHWKAIAAKVEERLQVSMNQSGVQVVGVVSAPATGKSTELAAHIHQLVNQGRAPKPAVYVIPTMAEATMVGRWLMNSAGLESVGSLGTDAQFMITSLHDFLSPVNIDSIDGPITLILDVNWYPDVAEELFYAQLARRLRMLRDRAATQTIHVSLVLFMSAFESERTTNLFRRAVGASSVCVYECDTVLPNIDIMRLPTEWKTTSRIRNAAAHYIHYRARVILAVGEDMPLGFRSDDMFDDRTREIPIGEGDSMHASEVQAIDSSEVLAIDGDIKYSTSIGGLRLFVSSGVAANPSLLDRETMQLVQRPSRPLEYCELLRQLSWVYKSGRPLDEVTFMATWDKAELSQRRERAAADSVERLGPAWNRDLALLVLGIIREFPDRHREHMPLRKALVDYAWAEMLIRLQLLGSIAKLGPGKYKSTERGDKVLQNYRAYGTDFHASFLLAYVAMYPEVDPVVMKLAIRIAALVKQGFGTLFANVQPDEVLTEHDFGFFSPPLTRFKAHHGAIWFALSLFLKGETERLFELEETLENKDLPNWLPLGPIRVARDAFREAKKLINRLDSDHNVPQDRDLTWMSVPLTTEQTKAIDRALMWSWLHRMVFFEKRPKLVNLDRRFEIVTEITSFQKCRVDLGKETMDIVRMREQGGGEDKKTGAAAIYMRLSADENDGLHARWLTSVPPGLFDEFNKETSLTWPVAIIKTNW